MSRLARALLLTLVTAASPLAQSQQEVREDTGRADLSSGLVKSQCGTALHPRSISQIEVGPFGTYFVRRAGGEVERYSAVGERLWGVDFSFGEGVEETSLYDITVSPAGEVFAVGVEHSRHDGAVYRIRHSEASPRIELLARFRGLQVSSIVATPSSRLLMTALPVESLDARRVKTRNGEDKWLDVPVLYELEPEQGHIVRVLPSRLIRVVDDEIDISGFMRTRFVFSPKGSAFVYQTDHALLHPFDFSTGQRGVPVALVDPIKIDPKVASVMRVQILPGGYFLASSLTAPGGFIDSWEVNLIDPGNQSVISLASQQISAADAFEPAEAVYNPLTDSIHLSNPVGDDDADMRLLFSNRGLLARDVLGKLGVRNK
ncbi:MAG TPA: hypothetical protein VLU25_10375 [Acidobacteriota bacterium]|nr:hypothetical protein [Acidobacteriota bacterium]